MGERFSELRRGGGIIAGALEGNEEAPGTPWLWRGRLPGFCLAKRLRLGCCPQPRSVWNQIGRVPAALPEEAAARDAQQGDRDGRAPRSQARLTALFSSFSAKLRTVG